MRVLWRLLVRTGRKIHVHIFDGVHCDPPACTRCGRSAR